MIQLYGQFAGYWSNAYVSRGIVAGLLANGIDVCAMDYDGHPLPEGLWAETWDAGGGGGGGGGAATRVGHFLAGQSDAVVGAWVGYPLRAVPTLAPYARKIGFFIAESAQLPADWGWAADLCDLVVVPSTWVRTAYYQAQVKLPKLLVAPHGLHPVYHTAAPPRTPPDPAAGLEFLHVSGARDFLARKGTPQLIRAFADVFHPTTGTARYIHARLTIRTPPSPQVYSLIAATGVPELFEVDAHYDALAPDEMRAYYLARSWAAVIQPSRAEAFGLVPLEARACGIPVLATYCAGHAMHAATGDYFPILHGAVTPLATNGIPNATAPDVAASAIAEALLGFTQQPPAPALPRNSVAAWRWAVVMQPVAARIRELEQPR